jgi:hypothetical protein
MPVFSLEAPPQPAVPVAGGAAGVKDVDANAGIGVEVLVTIVPPPHAMSVVNSSAAHTRLISSPCFASRPTMRGKSNGRDSGRPLYFSPRAGMFLNIRNHHRQMGDSYVREIELEIRF